MDSNNRARSGIVIAIILVVAAIYSFRLFALQLTDDEGAENDPANTTTYTTYVAAARGDILDRHGNVLVSNRATYSVTLQTFAMLNDDNINDDLLKLAEVCEKNGLEYQDTLPISDTEPYTYTKDDLSSAETYYFKKFMQTREWDIDMTVENLVAKMKDAYDITDDYTQEQQRIIMGMRYELDLPRYANAETWTVVEDIDADQLAVLKELGLPGMEVTTDTVREYHTGNAAQLLGHVGSMTDTQYEDYYQALGYNMDAEVGQDGFEEAFEEYLHGTDGQKVITINSEGTTVDEYWEVEPESGNNVITTIDIDLQQIAEESLAARIQQKADGKVEGQDGYDANSGAVVVMNPNTGEILAAANYPTYDGRNYYDDYEEMLEDEDNPMANRALMYAFAPGSTFKMITSIAALRNGISDDFTVDAKGIYDVYEDEGYAPKCWIYTESGSTHGVVDMRQALSVSCNIFFYTIGDTIHIEPIKEVAESFGFGQSTGVEMIENTGRMASPEVKESLYTGVEAGWYAADNLMAAIGQSDTTATPLQLCRYVSTLATCGTQYNATFFRRAVSSDFQSLVAENTFEPTATNLMSAEEYQVIKDGMTLCATEGTAEEYIRNSLTYTICCKTGTAQHGTGGSDNGAFVCWAPADDPQIAVAVYVEHGASGGYYATVAQDIITYYFNSENVAQEVPEENAALEER